MTFREKLHESRQLIPLALLILLVFLSLLLGWATATECAAWGVMGSLAIAWWHNALTWESFWASVMGTVRVNCMIMLILAGASYMSTSMAYTGIPVALATWVDSFHLSPYALIAALTVMYMVLGTALDGISDRAHHGDCGSHDQAGRLRPRLVRDFCCACSGNGGGVAPRGFQFIRASNNERKGFEHGGPGVAAVFLPARLGGSDYHGVSDIVMVLPRLAFPG